MAGKKKVMIHNTSHRFRQISETQTLFELEMQDVKFIGLLPKLMSKLIGGMFERYHQKQVDQFKTFTENQKLISNNITDNKCCDANNTGLCVQLN